MKNYTNIPQSNYTIVTTHTVVDKLLEVLKDVSYNEAIIFLKMAQNERTRLNGLTIMEEVSKFAKEHPKIKEPSNAYKK